jgi:hypothetical protein
MYIWYLAGSRPHDERTHNWSETFNEVLTLIFFYCIILFVDVALMSGEAQYKAGIFTCVLLGFILVWNVLFTVGRIIGTMVAHCKRRKALMRVGEKRATMRRASLQQARRASMAQTGRDLLRTSREQ